MWDGKALEDPPNTRVVETILIGQLPALRVDDRSASIGKLDGLFPTVHRGQGQRDDRYSQGQRAACAHFVILPILPGNTGCQSLRAGATGETIVSAISVPIGDRA